MNSPFITYAQTEELIRSGFVKANGSYGGVATPSQTPDTSSGPIWYWASEKGTYDDFGGVEIEENEVLAMLSYDGDNWSKTSIELRLKEVYTNDNVNLFSHDFLEKGWQTTTGTDPETIINSGSSRSFWINVEGMDYISISRKNYDNDRFRFGFIEGDISDGAELTNYENHDESLKIEGIEVPNNHRYLFVFASSGSLDGIISAKIKVENSGRSTKYTPYFENFLTLDNLVNSLDSDNEKKALTAKQGKELKGLIESISNSFSGSIGDIQEDLVVFTDDYEVHKMDFETGGILADTGEKGSSSGYSNTDWIEVFTGQKIIVSTRIAGNLTHNNNPVYGVAGYGTNDVDSYVRSLDSEGFPVGMIFSQDRGEEDPEEGRSYLNYSSVEITIPDGVNYIIGSTVTKVKSQIEVQKVVKLKEYVLELEPDNEEEEKSLPSYATDEINIAKKKLIDLNLEKRFLNFIFITDNHINLDGNNLISEKTMQQFSNERMLDFVAGGGDFVDAYDMTKQDYINQSTNILNIYGKINKPLYLTPGNHDRNSKMDEEDVILNMDFYNLYNASMSNYPSNRKPVFDDVESSDEFQKNYYYIDFKDHRIRLIVVNTHQRAKKERVDVRQIQIDWLENEAFDLPDSNWGAVIIQHVMRDINHLEDLRQLYADNSDKIISVIAGHEHKDQDEVIDGYQTVWTDCSLVEKTEWVGNKDEICFDIVTVDTENKKIYFTRVGRGNDRNFEYNKE